MKQFKAGDKVYCPHFSTGILTLVQSEKSNNLLAFEHCNKLIDITKDGKIWDSQGLVADIFHATEENHALLEKLYGVEFEAPPVKPSSREIIQAMLDRGDEYVSCWVDDENKNPTCNDLWVFIHSVSDAFFTDERDISWRYATPFDPRTGKAIIDFNTETGEIVTE